MSPEMTMMFEVSQHFNRAMIFLFNMEENALRAQQLAEVD